MDQQNQPFGKHQASSAENETPSSAEVRQELQVALPEVRLFKRITIWTLLLGIMIGSFLTLFGIELFRAQLQISDVLTAHLFGPLTMIPMGTAWILQWRIQRLRSQLPGLQQTTVGPFQPLSGLMGFALIGIAVFTLIAPYLPPEAAMPIIEYGGLGTIFLIISIHLYASLRSNRRTTKR